MHNIIDNVNKIEKIWALRRHTDKQYNFIIELSWLWLLKEGDRYVETLRLAKAKLVKGLPKLSVVPYHVVSFSLKWISTFEV